MVTGSYCTQLHFAAALDARILVRVQRYGTVHCTGSISLSVKGSEGEVDWLREGVRVRLSPTSSLPVATLIREWSAREHYYSTTYSASVCCWNVVWLAADSGRGTANNCP